MPTLKKNSNRKPSKKAKQPQTAPKTSIKYDRMPLEEAKLPAKFTKMNEMLKKTTFLP